MNSLEEVHNWWVLHYLVLLNKFPSANSEKKTGSKA
jgi:hypothetical protein